MTKVLVTGASGFIGQRCVQHLLNRDFNVIAASRTALDFRDARVETVQVDLLDSAMTRLALEKLRPTRMIHAAWQPVHGDVMASPRNWDWLKASIDLIEAFREAGGERVAVVGSCAEYDWRYGICRPDTTPLVAGSIYGAAKNALRNSLDVFSKSSGLSFVWPRPFFIYGPGENPTRLVAHVVRSLLEGRPAEISHGRQVRDYLHIGDVASGIVASLLSDHEGPVDLASGEPISLRELVLEVARQTGREDLVRIGARQSPPDEAPVVLGDPGPAEAAIGWRRELTLGAGIADTIKAARQSMAGQEKTRA